MKSTKKWPRKI